MYKCKPEINVTQMRLIVFIGLISSIGAYIAGSALETYGGYLKLLGFVFLCVFLMLLIRHVLSEYEYSVDGENFTVTRFTGKRSTVVCCLNLSTAIEVYKKSDYAALPKQEKAILKYSLNQNIKADSYVFLCEFNGKRAMVEFEPNEIFVKIMRDQIENAKKRESDDERQDPI